MYGLAQVAAQIRRHRRGYGLYCEVVGVLLDPHSRRLVECAKLTMATFPAWEAVHSTVAPSRE
jgi:hypothetical protein